jgi:beta-glucosidase
MFDPKGSGPYDNISANVINSDAHRQLAKRVALESIVMVKNNGVLPLRNDLPKYYVTGPNAANVDALIGNYYGVNPQMSTILEGLASGVSHASQIQYKPGFLLDRLNINPIDWTTDDAKASNVTFVVMGINGLLEGEEGEAIASPNYGDKLDYNLPQNQIDFLKKLRNGNTNKIVAIVTGGSPMNLAEVQNLADAVLLVWYPGEEGGHAISDIVFGKVSPSGRIPVTFPKSLDQLPPYESYSMKGRTYRYMTAEPLYPFGFGLSYTTFDYSNIKLSAENIKKNTPLKATATVTNTGKMEADEVVQFYITPPQTGDNPLYSLKGFKRIHLKPGEAQDVEFDVTPELLQSINDNGIAVELAGKYSIYIGGSVPTERSTDLGASKSAVAVLTVK